MASDNTNAPAAARVHLLGAVGLASALALVPTAIYAGAWFVLPLCVAMGAVVYLWRP